MDNIIFGIRPVAEAIEAGKQIEKLYIRKGAEGQLMSELRDLCFRHKVRVQEALDIYFYLEGCDPDCSDSVSFDNANLHLAFYGAVSQKEGS